MKQASRWRWTVGLAVVLPGTATAAVAGDLGERVDQRLDRRGDRFGRRRDRWH